MKLKFKFAVIVLLLLCAQNMFSQTKTISGTVTDDAGMPMPGVSVMVEGTNNGVQTDFDGNYNINEVSPSDKLIFSYVGMNSQSILVGEQTSISVTLEYFKK